MEFRSQALAEALERQDMAAVALALRNGNTVVPLLKPGPRDRPLDGGEVWTYRDPGTGDVALLLFSDAANKPARQRDRGARVFKQLLERIPRRA